MCAINYHLLGLRRLVLVLLRCLLLLNQEILDSLLLILRLSEEMIAVALLEL